ncbi:MAG: glycosyl transferase [Clostridium lundense]|nr:glycosyl transferase [Clostridium lundense]
MIPKIIHYCWFGKNEKTELINKCIESWKKYCPDYQIKEWNEDIFDINSNQYVKEAYENKKWAFVSDYVRLHALYNEGGIYVDTDLEIKKNIDKFLYHKAFSGYESNNSIPTAIMGAEKCHAWIKELLDYYEDRNFILRNGKLDLTTNVRIITDITIKKYNIVLDNTRKTFGCDVNIYPKEYFCKQDIKMPKENYSIHHFAGSWLDSNQIKMEMLLYKNYYYIFNSIIEDISNNNLKLSRYLNKVKTFAIYGVGSLGKLLIHQCSLISREPNYIIDNYNKNDFYNNIEIVNSEDIGEKVELLIITPIMKYNDIYKNLDKKWFKHMEIINNIYDTEFKVF